MLRRTACRSAHGLAAPLARPLVGEAADKAPEIRSGSPVAADRSQRECRRLWS